jgi:hypothetical protein
MSPEIFPYIVILVPLLLIAGISIFFYRLFTKSQNKDREYLNKIKELEACKNAGEFKSARIISVQPYQGSMYTPGMRTVNMRFEIEDTPGNFKMYSAQWQVNDFYSSQFQPDDKIQVKVYNDYVFPAHDGAKLLP